MTTPAPGAPASRPPPRHATPAGVVMATPARLRSGTRLPVQRLRGPVRPTRLVARPVTLRPSRQGLRGHRDARRGPGPRPGAHLERVVEIWIGKRIAVKIRHRPGTARHPPEPGADTQTRRGRRPPARSRRRRRRAIRVQLAGHLAGRATEHARCGGGPRRPAIRLSLPAWICAPGSASDRSASAGGEQVTSSRSMGPT